jgi:hypothetical protein
MILFQAILIMEIAINRYGSYEEFENQTGLLQYNVTCMDK